MLEKEDLTSAVKTLRGDAAATVKSEPVVKSEPGAEPAPKGKQGKEKPAAKAKKEVRHFLSS